MVRSADSCKGSRQDATTLLDSALAYADRGWSIIPTRDKRAACKWKPFQQERPDDKSLRRLFAAPGITGLAVILGPVSGGLACRDFDVQSAFDLWAGAHADLARSLPTVATARGRHVYFQASGAGGIRKLSDGELRCSGGYCLLPPALHPSGTTYLWLVSPPKGDMPVVDPYQTGLCNREDTEDGVNGEDGANTAHPSLLVSTAPSLLSTSSLLQAVEKAIAATLPTTQGQRNRCIFQFARQLKGIASLKNADLVTLHIAGNSDFFLNCRTAGRLIGVDHSTAWRYLEVLCADGILAPGAKGSNATHKANRFRFIDPNSGDTRQ